MENNSDRTKLDAFQALNQFYEYEEDYQHNFKIERRASAEELRAEFVKKYPIDRINTLTIDEYCRGDDSFIRTIRYNLQGLASMGNAYPDVFGLYARKGNDEIALSRTFDKLSNGDIDKAFIIIKNEIHTLLTSFNDRGFDVIRELHLNNMYIYKLLIIYYPDRVFHVCARAKLESYCNCVGLSIKKNDEMSVGIQKLLDWKNKVSLFSEWNNSRLMSFCDWLDSKSYYIDGSELIKNGKKSNEWLISGNPERFNVIRAFRELKRIDWRQSVNISIGDIVYIYISHSVQSIKLKCKVNKINLPILEIDDRKYELSSEPGPSDGRFMELELIEEFDTELFDRNILENYGFIAPQGQRRLPEKLKEYLDIVQSLIHSTEMDPDKHDGSYELARETVRAYKNMGDLGGVNYRDLNLLYHMIIGTEKFDIKHKKESVDKSNLPNEEKTRLKALLDSVWQKAIDKEYENSDKLNASIGIIDTSYYSFDSSDNGEAAETFLGLCVDILDMTDDETIFETVEKYFTRELAGLKTGSASIMLHCLKPYTFPIFNTKLESNNIFRYFNIDIYKMNQLTTYGSNCKKIKAFRDKYFAVKNYRIFDRVAYKFFKADISESNMIEDEMLQDMKTELNDNEVKYPLNTILYGPPGTGKTYSSILYAVGICENTTIEELKKKDYREILELFDIYRKAGYIAFTTFHQSYGYEEFIEGIKPVMDDSDDMTDDIGYRIEDGIFKKFCNHAMIPTGDSDTESQYGLNKNPNVWKVSLEGTGDNPTRTECMDNSHIRIGWDQYGESITDDIDYSEQGGKTVLNSFMNKMQIGDIVLSCYSANTIDAIGVITGDYEWHPEYNNHKRLRKVNWLAKGLNYNIVEINGGVSMTLSTVYKLKVSVSDVFKILDDVKASDIIIKPDTIKRHVFIIDEINRGNISKIFGELITLIEDTKRIGADEELRLELPYSKKKFGVPKNVYIIGTMNTADRSIALMDTALRRRFNFIEMMPDTKVLDGVKVEADGESVDISKLLQVINKRIEYLYDREHTIGHSFFIPLKKEPTMEKLAEIFEKNVIPLLKEYFYEDYSKIQIVLGDNNKSDEYKFIKDTSLNIDEVFSGNVSDLDLPGQTYELQREALTKIKSYKGISKNL